MPGKQTRRTFLAGVTGVMGATTLASAQSQKHLAIVGGSASNPVEYYFLINGEVEKTADGGGAIDDGYVSINSEDYVETTSNDGTYREARGVVAGGGDAYYYTGEIVNFGVSLDQDTADRASIYHDGREYGVEEFGPNPPAGTPITYRDAQHATIDGEWGSVSVTDMIYEPNASYTEYYILDDLNGTTAITEESIQIPNWYLYDLGLHEMENAGSEPVHHAANPFGGPWNLEVRESDLPNRIVLYGGSADDPLEYRFDVSGDVRKTGYAGDDAPIDDRHVHIDIDDYIDGDVMYTGDGSGSSTVTGSVAGGGDAYWFSGDVTDLQADEGTKVYVDGEPREPDEPTSGGGDGEDELSRHVVVFGGSADNIISYELAVSGELAKSDSGGDAPIDDQYVTIDDDDVIEGSTASGTIGGGGDAYRFSGEVTNVEADGDARVYVDGERRT